MLTDLRSRPTQLSALAIICLAAGALLLLSGFSLVIVGGVLGMNGVQIGSTKDPLIAFVFGFVTLTLAGAYLVLYNGFWTVRPWAFTGGFLVAGAGIVTVLAGLLFGYGATDPAAEAPTAPMSSAGASAIGGIESSAESVGEPPTNGS